MFLTFEFLHSNRLQVFEMPTCIIDDETLKDSYLKNKKKTNSFCFGKN